jgi:hypothetical protein
MSKIGTWASQIWREWWNRYLCKGQFAQIWQDWWCRLDCFIHIKYAFVHKITYLFMCARVYFGKYLLATFAKLANLTSTFIHWLTKLANIANVYIRHLTKRIPWEYSCESRECHLNGHCLNKQHLLYIFTMLRTMVEIHFLLFFFFIYSPI